MSTLDAKRDFNEYKQCMGQNTNENKKDICANALKKTVDSVSHVISRECLPFTEDLYKCFKHSFRLSFCDKEVTEKLKTCHTDMYKLISS